MSTNTKVGNKANTRKTTESGGEVLKNLTRLWPGSSSTRANRAQSNEGRHRREKERGKNKEGGRVCAPRIEGKRKLEALISLQSEQPGTGGKLGQRWMRGSEIKTKSHDRYGGPEGEVNTNSRRGWERRWKPWQSLARTTRSPGGWGTGGEESKVLKEDHLT